MKTKRFNRIHAICQNIRCMGPYKTWRNCERCPAWEADKHYGKVQRGCYWAARETYNIAKYGNPWGRKAKSANVARWRKRKLTAPREGEK